MIECFFSILQFWRWNWTGFTGCTESWLKRSKQQPPTETHERFSCGRFFPRVATSSSPPRSRQRTWESSWSGSSQTWTQTAGTVLSVRTVACSDSSCCEHKVRRLCRGPLSKIDLQHMYGQINWVYIYWANIYIKYLLLYSTERYALICGHYKLYISSYFRTVVSST